MRVDDERPSGQRRGQFARARGMSGMLWTGILLSESICLVARGRSTQGIDRGHTKDKRAKLHVVQGALTAFVCRTTFIVPTWAALQNRSVGQEFATGNRKWHDLQSYPGAHARFHARFIVAHAGAGHAVQYDDRYLTARVHFPSLADPERNQQKTTTCGVARLAFRLRLLAARWRGALRWRCECALPLR